MPARQTTPRSFTFDGIDVHSGAPTRMILHAADPGSGVAFLRTGLASGRERLIPATIRNVAFSFLAIRLALPEAPDEGVGTVEHILAALSAAGVVDALIEIDGPAVPVLDGSAAPFLAACAMLRRAAPSAALPAIEILAPLRVALGESFAEFRPAAGSLTLDIGIDYPHPLIGKQQRAMKLSHATFARDIAGARTFGFVADAEKLWRDGFAKGSDFENTIVLDGDRVLNPGGLRFPDEFVRHKTLDAIGDLALAGAPIHGLFRSHRGGHALNRLAVETLFATPSAWRWREGARRRPRTREIYAATR